MDKEKSDKIITSYMKKIFGFALTKTKNIDKAEELASRIIFEVYKSLLKSDNILSIDKYIYRISCNVYSHFVEEEIDEISFTHNNKVIQIEPKISNDTTYNRIRDEISYLSRLQREIIVMFYFQKLKLTEIAKKLNLPLGTVSWHLSEGRNTIKDGFNDDKKKSISSKEIIFNKMYSAGSFGVLLTDISFYFQTSFSQNIAFSVYHKAKTSSEIAKELSVPTAFVEDELAQLIDNGFMNKVPGNKYLTNIYIIENNQEQITKANEILIKYANKVSEIYIPSLFSLISDNESMLNNIYSPNEDKNFLMWSIVSYACFKKLFIIDYKNDLTKFMISRKDGGHNIAIARISENLRRNSSPELIKRKLTKAKNDLNYINADITSNNFYKDLHPISSWSFLSEHDDRMGRYKDFDISIFEILYDFMTGKLEQKKSHLEKYQNLFDLGFIMSKGKSEYVNIVVSAISEKDFDLILPPIPDKLIKIGKELDEEMYNISKPYFPSHQQELCRVFCQNYLASGNIRTIILDNLIKKKFLKPLKKNQKKTVNMIMFCDILPLGTNNE